MKAKICGSLLIIVLSLITKVFAEDISQESRQSNNHIRYTIKDTLPFYKERAAQGDVNAQMMMGQIYAMGDIVQTDMKQAFFWFHQAAQQNNPEAQFKVAEMYLYGHGVERDFSYAEKWAAKSAKQGYANSEYLLGLLYVEGKGVPKDWQQALIWLCRAASKGSQQAIELLETRTIAENKLSLNKGDEIKELCNCNSGRLSDCR